MSFKKIFGLLICIGALISCTVTAFAGVPPNTVILKDYNVAYDMNYVSHSYTAREFISECLTNDKKNDIFYKMESTKLNDDFVDFETFKSASIEDEFMVYYYDENGDIKSLKIGGLDIVNAKALNSRTIEVYFNQDIDIDNFGAYENFSWRKGKYDIKGFQTLDTGECRELEISRFIQGSSNSIIGIIDEGEITDNGSYDFIQNKRTTQIEFFENGDSISQKEIYLEDKEAPQIIDVIASVESNSMYFIFSEPVWGYRGEDEFLNTYSVYNVDKYLLDGKPLSEIPIHDFKVGYFSHGDYYSHIDEFEGVDFRNTVKIEFNDKYILPEGEHTLFVDSIADSAFGEDGPNLSTPKEIKFYKDKTFTSYFVYQDKNINNGICKDDEDIGNNDAVYIKFSEEIDLETALDSNNYLLNGESLPAESKITPNIITYDDDDDIVDSITIELPDGTIRDAWGEVILLSSNIKNKNYDAKIINRKLYMPIKVWAWDGNFPYENN